jgi:hypothetical protein
MMCVDAAEINVLALRIACISEEFATDEDAIM